MNIIDINNTDQLIQLVTDGYARIHGMTAGAIVMLVVGLLCCFMGFRLAKYVFALFGALLGAGLCAYVAAIYLPAAFVNIGSIICAIIGAALVGYLFFHIYKVAVFVFCACIGAAVGSVPAAAVGLGAATSPAYIIAIVVCAVLFGVAGLLFLKPVLIVITGLGGFLAAPQIFMLGNISGGLRMQLLAGAGLSVVGIIVQVLTNRKRSVPGFGKPKSDTEETQTAETDSASEETMAMPFYSSAQQYEEIDETPAVPKMTADGIYELMSKRIFLRLLMAVSSILAILASAAAIYGVAMHGVLVLAPALIFAFFCYAGKRYKALSLSFALMLAASCIQAVMQYMAMSRVQAGVTAGIAFLVLCLLISALVMNKRANPKKVIRRVPIQTEPTEAEVDSFEATRPLSASEVEDVMSAPIVEEDITEVADPEIASAVDGDDTIIVEETQLMDRDEAATELMGDPEETQLMDSESMDETRVLNDMPENETRLMDEPIGGDTRAFTPGTPEDFIKTQQEIFDDAKPTTDYDDMAEESLDETQNITN